jgi:hypothetical protein
MMFSFKWSRIVGLLLFLIQGQVRGQFLMDKIDTTKELSRTTYRTIDRYNHIRISGYIQPQYQVASEKGAESFAGGDFAPQPNNRFMLRRGRIRFDYALTDLEQRNKVQVAFQLDATERGVFVRDLWGRYWENKWELLSFTTGMFARPFGFEVNLSSSDRESPERGRMSQTLMKTERDLGIMATIESRKAGSKWSFLEFDLGIFNGQGLTAPGEYDSYKDFIGQMLVKSRKLGNKLTVSGGLSYFLGGIVQNADYSYRMEEKGAYKSFVADSTTAKEGGKLPRRYYGMNLQFKHLSAWGATEIRGEMWKGEQTGSEFMSETPAYNPNEPGIGFLEPLYVRPFRGGFFYFLQHIVNRKHQIALKYDFYDPNVKVEGKEIGDPASNFTRADIKFSTVGAGYISNINESLKLVIWYDWVKNESTALPGYESDRSDNVFTIRAQFRF